MRHEESGVQAFALTAILTVVMAGHGHATAEEDSGLVTIEDEACHIEFDRNSGALRGMVNRVTNDACLKSATTNNSAGWDSRTRG